MDAAAREPLVISRPRVLMVEGREDQICFEELIRHIGIASVQVLVYGGKMNVRTYLRAVSLAPGFADVTQAIVTRDADDDPVGAFQSIHDALIATGLPAPANAWEYADGVRRVGVAILPSFGAPGMLEDVFVRAGATDSAMPCVDAYFDCLQGLGLPLPGNMSKSKLQVLLASKADGNLRLGESARRGYWRWEHPAFDELRNFLLAVFAT